MVVMSTRMVPPSPTAHAVSTSPISPERPPIPLTLPEARAMARARMLARVHAAVARLRGDVSHSPFLETS